MLLIRLLLALTAVWAETPNCGAKVYASKLMLDGRSYGTAKENKLDLYIPVGAPKPYKTIFFIHGGCFQFGARDSKDSKKSQSSFAPGMPWPASGTAWQSQTVRIPQKEKIFTPLPSMTLAMHGAGCRRTARTMGLKTIIWWRWDIPPALHSRACSAFVIARARPIHSDARHTSEASFTFLAGRTL